MSKQQEIKAFEYAQFDDVSVKPAGSDYNHHVIEKQAQKAQKIVNDGVPSIGGNQNSSGNVQTFDFKTQRHKVTTNNSAKGNVHQVSTGSAQSRAGQPASSASPVRSGAGFTVIKGGDADLNAQPVQPKNFSSANIHSAGSVQRSSASSNNFANTSNTDISSKDAALIGSATAIVVEFIKQDLASGKSPSPTFISAKMKEMYHILKRDFQDI